MLLNLLKILAASLALNLVCLADSAPNIITLKILQKKVEFTKIRPEGIFIESRCLKKQSNCQASSAATKAQKIAWNDLAPLGSTTPGTRVCIAMGAAVVTGRDEKLNEYALCQFKDKSIISSDELSRHLKRN